MYVDRCYYAANDDMTQIGHSLRLCNSPFTDVTSDQVSINEKQLPMRQYFRLQPSTALNPDSGEAVRKKGATELVIQEIQNDKDPSQYNLY